MKIIGICNIVNTDDKQFIKDVNKSIVTLQNDDQTIEVQYKVNSLPNGQIVHSALILGRR